MTFVKLTFAAIVALAVIGCTGNASSQKRRVEADQLAQSANWHQMSIHTTHFDFEAFVPNRPNREPEVTIYIEGDGAAWKNKYKPSDDPTPNDPVALKLALAQPTGYAMYLGRPCQYTGRGAVGCDQKYWTNERFAEAVIAGSSEALDVLKRQSGATQIRLVGFSGGGSVATLVAARRHDIVQLVTVSGNLNVTQWVLLHSLTPLDGLDPIDVAKKLPRLPQLHFVGSADENTTLALVRSFADKIPKPNKAEVIVKEGNKHNCCWANQWPLLWPLIRAQVNNNR